MKSYLILVESPNKCQKISNILNDNLDGKFYVEASVGHIMDLPIKELGIDIKNNFNPSYEILSTKKKNIRNIKKLLNKVDEVYLACDNDREGERIAFDLIKVLGLKKYKRIVFNEITKDAIIDAFNNPVELNLDVINAQSCRRILDRLIGYKLSPLLRKYVNKNSSAGRVQSVVTKLLYDKNVELNNYTPLSDFKVYAHFNKDIIGTLNKTFKTLQEVKKFLQVIQNKKLVIQSIDTIDETVKAPKPYITSTLQQDCCNKLKIPIKKANKTLQELYQKGIITYIRTDSYNISNNFTSLLQEHINNNYGEMFQLNKHNSGKYSQNAHECIRPTSLHCNEILSKDEKSIYNMILKRTIASQMKDHVVTKYKYSVSIDNMDELFQFTIYKTKYSGWKILYNDYDKKILQENIGDELKYQKIVGEEHFSSYPKTYSESSLIRKMEEIGIGRPSTYAHVVSSIQDKGYAQKMQIKGPTVRKNSLIMTYHHIIDKCILEPLFIENNKLQITELGIKNTEYLEEYFDKIMDYKYTSNLEEMLDIISTGQEEWATVVKHYFDDFYPIVLNLTNNNTKEIKEIKDKYKPKTSKKNIGDYNNLTVYTYISKYGPVVQLGDEKPKYANIPKNININSITLEQAINLLQYPKYIGDYKQVPVFLHNGPYGYYIKWNNNNFSVKNIKPEDVNISYCENLLKN